MSTPRLSKKAQEIMKQLEKGKSLKEVIEEKPDLKEALDEYHAWLEGQRTATDEGSSEPPPVSHPLLGR